MFRCHICKATFAALESLTRHTAQGHKSRLNNVLRADAMEEESGLPF